MVPPKSSSRGCGDQWARAWHCFGGCGGCCVVPGRLRSTVISYPHARKTDLFYGASFHISAFSVLRLTLAVPRSVPYFSLLFPKTWGSLPSELSQLTSERKPPDQPHPSSGLYLKPTIPHPVQRHWVAQSFSWAYSPIFEEFIHSL